MMGGAWFNELFGNADEVDTQMFGQIAIEAVKEQLHIDKKPFRVISGVVKVRSTLMFLYTMVKR